MRWLDYRLQDFLLVAPDTYWRLFEQANQAVWPFPLIVPLLLACCLAARRRFDRTVPYILAGLLAAAWVWCGGYFVGRWYAPVNWLAAYAVPAFYLQALLLLWFGLVRNGFGGPPVKGARRVVGWTLTAGALLLYPLAALPRGQGVMGGEFAGTAPDPTAIATLGLCLLTRKSAAAACLPIPLLVCAASFLTLWAMESWQAWIPLAAAAVTAVMLATSSRAR